MAISAAIAVPAAVPAASHVMSWSLRLTCLPSSILAVTIASNWLLLIQCDTASKMVLVKHCGITSLNSE